MRPGVIGCRCEMVRELMLRRQQEAVVVSRAAFFEQQTLAVEISTLRPHFGGGRGVVFREQTIGRQPGRAEKRRQPWRAWTRHTRTEQRGQGIARRTGALVAWVGFVVTPE